MINWWLCRKLTPYYYLFSCFKGSDSDEADTKKTAPRVNKKVILLFFFKFYCPLFECSLWWRPSSLPLIRGPLLSPFANIFSQGPHQGLASLLPAPQAMIVREGNKPLIPHAVSRRTAAPKAAPKADAPQPAPEVEEPSKMKSFFALDDDEDEDEAMPISNLAPRPLDSEPVGPKRSNEVGTPMEAGPALPEVCGFLQVFILLASCVRLLTGKRRNSFLSYYLALFYLAFPILAASQGIFSLLRKAGSVKFVPSFETKSFNHWVLILFIFELVLNRQV